jgi:hypothetical protein
MSTIMFEVPENTEPLLDTIQERIETLWKTLVANADNPRIQVDTANVWIADAELVNHQGIVVLKLDTTLHASDPGLRNFFLNQDTIDLMSGAAGVVVKADFPSLSLMMRDPDWRVDVSMKHQ